MVKSKFRILVADPDPDIRDTLQLYFEANNHKVQTVDRVDDVLKMARAWQPHAILVSAEFRDDNPQQVYRALTGDTLIGHIPVIMLLHLDDRQARLRALEVGIADIITKPFDIEELLLRVEAAIRLSTTRGKINIINHS